MDYQVFRGADVKEALRAVRTSLGPDAVIGSTQQVSAAARGGIGQSYVEIKAAPAPGGQRTNGPFSADIPELQRVERLEGVKPGPRLGKQRGNVATAVTRTSVALAGRPSIGGVRSKTSGLAIEDIERELQTLRAMLEELHNSRAPRDRVLAYLSTLGLEGKVARELAGGANKAIKTQKQGIQSFVEQRLRERLEVQPGLIHRRRPQILTMVGPTGVGKTTTLAKIAARARLEVGRSVAVISLDLFRVGAVEQWQRYAQLMGMPFAVAQDAPSFERAVAQSRAELLLIDTPGRGVDGDPATRIVADVLPRITEREVHTHVVIPAWLRGDDAERVVHSYGMPRLTGVVLSKLDEATRLGGALHGALAGGLPISYLCNGPRVPEDIHDATLDAIIDAVFPEQP